METKTTPQNRFMTPKQLEEEYFFSEANQSQMRMKKRIPYVKVGGYRSKMNALKTNQEVYLLIKEMNCLMKQQKEIFNTIN